MSDVPMDLWGYTGQPKNWLDEARELSMFLGATEGDDIEPMPEDGVSPDSGGERR
jgi:hypothetical protein